MSRLHKSGIRGAIAGALALLGLSAPAAAQDCDRACLGGMIDRYIAALAAQDPSALPLADDVRFTENSEELELGQGAWRTVTAPGGFRQDYLDVEKQIAAAHFTMQEGAANTLLYSAVLHLEAGEIAGIETLVQQITPESRFQPTMLGAPIPHLNDPVGADPLSREEMIATALTYTEGLRIGSFADVTARFAEGTSRVENGVVTAGVGCGREPCDMQTQDIITHPDITASVAAVDEENGVVLLWMNFGDTNSYGEGNALVTFEAFKVWDGQIRAVQAFFPILKKETERGWPSSDPIPQWNTGAPLVE